MKNDIHPEYNTIKVQCITCSAEYEAGTTVKNFSIDVCSNCHPFYKGTTSSMKSTGRVERFNRMFGKDLNIGKKTKAKVEAKPEEKAKEDLKEVKSEIK